METTQIDMFNFLFCKSRLPGTTSHPYFPLRTIDPPWHPQIPTGLGLSLPTEFESIDLMYIVHKMCKLNNLGHINIDALLFCASGIFSRMKAFFVSNTLAALVFPSFCLGWKLECIDETFLHLIITALLMAVSVNFTYHYIQCPAVPSVHHLDCQFWTCF